MPKSNSCTKFVWYIIHIIIVSSVLVNSPICLNIFVILKSILIVLSWLYVNVCLHRVAKKLILNKTALSFFLYQDLSCNLGFKYSSSHHALLFLLVDDFGFNIMLKGLWHCPVFLSTIYARYYKGNACVSQVTFRYRLNCHFLWI